jgi:hypothetical protein
MPREPAKGAVAGMDPGRQVTIRTGAVSRCLAADGISSCRHQRSNTGPRVGLEHLGAASPRAESPSRPQGGISLPCRNAVTYGRTGTGDGFHPAIVRAWARVFALSVTPENKRRTPQMAADSLSSDLNVILGSTSPSELILQPERDVGGAWDEGFANNAKGQMMTISFKPGIGVTVNVNGTVKGMIEAPKLHGTFRSMIQIALGQSASAAGGASMRRRVGMRRQ